jgi:hypothetical protein
LEIAVSGSYAYMLDYTMYASVLDYTNGLQVFSISNPANPVLVGFCPITNILERLTVSGNYAYVTHTRNYPSTGAGLSIVDLSVPANPVIASTYWAGRPGSAEWLRAGGVAVAGNYAYLSAGGRWHHPEFGSTSIGNLEVINVSNPANPVYAGRVADFDFYESWDVAVSGQFAYAIYHVAPRPPTYPWEWGGLALINITNPNNPFWISYPTNLVRGIEYFTGQQHSQVLTSGNYAYLLGGSPDLRVIDISSPSNMVLAASLQTGGLRMAVSGHLAYLACGAQGLQIYCLESPRLSAELLGSQVLLQWPASATNWMLESAPSLPAQQWQAVPATPQRINDFYQLLIPATHPSAFFRLRGP